MLRNAFVAAFLCLTGVAAATDSGSATSISKEGRSSSYNAATYNLYWWWVSQNNQFRNLYNVINAQDFDVIGFQECDNVAQVVANTKMNGTFAFTAAGHAHGIAWNTIKYNKVQDGRSVIARDQYGDRILSWVRLQVRETGDMVFFANTHGPLGQSDGAAGETLANNWISAITGSIRSGDQLIFVGDFNVVASSTAMRRLTTKYSLVATGDSFGGVDHILTNNNYMPESWRIVPGWPSDHSLVRASFGAPPPTSPTTPPSPTPSPPSDCTGVGNDPWSQGYYKPCCAGLESCLKDWNGNGRWYYKCVAQC